MDDRIKSWFIEKVAQNPEYIASTYLPVLEKELQKAEARLRQANRVGTLEQIKLCQGWFDGVENCCKILDGLKLSEEKSRADPGLMDRIFGLRGLSPADHG